MEEKDLIVRFSGDKSKVDEALQQVIAQAAEIGLIGSDLRVNIVPKKVEKSKLQNRSATDIMVKVSSSEERAEAFMQDLMAIASESLGLNSPSTGIKLLKTDDDVKDE